ncbi:hypothetical protein WICANDRAFT_62037 [Wickerhamomyces anomalus NRRL Y-366-8]|uniref:Cell wall protein CWP1 n=1 Tax=Wickerhamomyces anomalus (strain ATCC 58044 / CBS 1984 / NCYC 433 / NRRL Y-366-8) TaxID=683960 RepID=A0A1E3P843_WICAA|nr:uncharacterized protein WICANDRAFT_62037 [Wickerhamomyces anomalus NRRL Y-366-8]ODQ61480.1 hypothetical protein WICANDRAFT_62037 [Wickerhamomyces anomalus NRRL Y-366-8]
MQFSISFFALALASLVVADSETIGLLTIRSGTQYHLSPIAAKDGAITDAGEFKFTDGTYAKVNSDGSISVSSSEGSKPFSIKSGYFAYKDSQAFNIDASNRDLIAGNGANPVALRATLKNGQEASDFTPSGSSSSGSSSSGSSSSNSTSSSSAAPTFATQTENGAAALQAGLGGLAAAAAVLLI